MASSPFPEMPPVLRTSFPVQFWNWWQAFKVYMMSGFFTAEDVTVLNPGKGIILTSPDGSKKKRLRLSDGGAVEVVDV